MITSMYLSASSAHKEHDPCPCIGKGGLEKTDGKGKGDAR